MSLIELLWPALILAIALVYIHSIFGIEIIKRGVIFTDLAIGQIAANGMAISIAFMDGAYQNLMTLCFALLGAGIITWATKNIHNIEEADFSRATLCNTKTPWGIENIGCKK